MASRARVWQKEWEPMPWDNRRRTACTETEEVTHDRQEQRMRNKREARMKRYREYQAYYYGSPQEREVHKSKLRHQLAEQVGQFEDSQRTPRFSQMVEESKRLAEEDTTKRQKEVEEEKKHRDFLAKFRDDNKMLIELHAEQRKAQRRAQLDQEKELLSHNPINWSHSLW